MRLQEIYSICKNVVESWTEIAFTESRNVNGGIYFKIANPTEIKNMLSQLECMDFLLEDINTVKKRSYGFSDSINEIVLDTRNKNILITEVTKIKEKMETIIDLFEFLDYTQCAEGFDVKLPNDLTLFELDECVKDLKYIFTCPLFSELEEPIRLVSVDVGSAWFNFAINGVTIAVILKIVAELVDKAIIIRSHYLTSLEQRETINSLKLGNDALKKAVDLYEEISNAEIDNATKELAEAHNISAPEDIQRVNEALERLVKLMNKGVEIYASVNSQHDVKAIFPPVEQQSLPSDIIGLLSSGDNLGNNNAE